MKHLRTLTVITLIFHLVMVACLSSMAHFNLCLGYDGHVDISFSECSKPQSVLLQTEMILLDVKEHHGDCVDIELLCDALNDEQLAILETGSSSVVRKGHEQFRKMRIGFDSFDFYLERNNELIPKTFDGPISSFQSRFLNTIVLLI